jgi:hypothetical protein
MGQHWCLARTGRLQARSRHCCVKQVTWPFVHTQLRQPSSIQVVPCGRCTPQDMACWGRGIIVGSGHLAQHCPGWWVGWGQGVGGQRCASHSTRPRWHIHCVQASRGHVSPSTRYTPSTEWHTITCCGFLASCSVRPSSVCDRSKHLGQSQWARIIGGSSQQMKVRGELVYLFHILAHSQAILSEVVHSFPQSLHINTRMTPQISPWRLPLTSFPICYSVIIPSFPAIYSF